MVTYHLNSQWRIENDPEDVKKYENQNEIERCQLLLTGNIFYIFDHMSFLFYLQLFTVFNNK